MQHNNTVPCDRDALPCVGNVLRYLSETAGKRIVTGQHTQTMEQEELTYIHDVTGKYPALIGFELLSYSPNINFVDTDDECMDEVAHNCGTLRRAWEWAQRKALLTFTWHWFSPLYGRSKSFFTANTEFDASRAVIPGTPENEALLSDMDVMAGYLRPFCDSGVPILWRPFHEGDGDWFWWGAKGADTVKALYRIMYERYTGKHGLHNLIWVWNSPVAECFPGDDVVDIISRDMYPEPHTHTSQREMYEELIRITDAPKTALIGETGTLPDPDAIAEEGVGWASFMTWSGKYCIGEEHNTEDALRRVYSSYHAVTLDKLPELY